MKVAADGEGVAVEIGVGLSTTLGVSVAVASETGEGICLTDAGLFRRKRKANTPQKNSAARIPTISE